MASVAVQASFMLSTGEVVDCKTTLTEGTEGELLTSTDYSVSAVSLGTYAEGKMITSIIQPVSAVNSCSYAYLDRRGEILMILPVQSASIQNKPQAPARMITLQAGDTIRVMCSVGTNRLFALSCITNTGVHAIFSGTPTGAGNTSLTHIKSGQGLGASLTNQSIVQHFATSIDGSKLDSGNGVYYLNDRGLPVGGCSATNTLNLQPSFNTVGGARIGLNFVARVTTNA
jgi:hypothetical protein